MSSSVCQLVSMAGESRPRQKLRQARGLPDPILHIDWLREERRVEVRSSVDDSDADRISVTLPARPGFRSTRQPPVSSWAVGVAIRRWRKPGKPGRAQIHIANARLAAGPAAERGAFPLDRRILSRYGL